MRSYNRNKSGLSKAEALRDRGYSLIEVLVIAIAGFKSQQSSKKSNLYVLPSCHYSSLDN
jgi:hypothetical protein